MSADQYEPIPTVKLSDGNEIPLVRPTHLNELISKAY